MGFPGGSDGRESACHAADLSSIPRLLRAPGEGNGNPLLYSCLENFMDREPGRLHIPWGPKEPDTFKDWLTLEEERGMGKTSPRPEANQAHLIKSDSCFPFACFWGCFFSIQFYSPILKS